MNTKKEATIFDWRHYTGVRRMIYRTFSRLIITLGVTMLAVVGLDIAYWVRTGESTPLASVAHNPTAQLLVGIAAILVAFIVGTVWGLVQAKAMAREIAEEAGKALPEKLSRWFDGGPSEPLRTTPSIEGMANSRINARYGFEIAAFVAGGMVLATILYQIGHGFPPASISLMLLYSIPMIIYASIGAGLWNHVQKKEVAKLKNDTARNAEGFSER